MMHALVPALFAALAPQAPDLTKMVGEAKLTMSQAIERGLREARSGVAVQAELEFEKGHTVWSMDIAQGTKVLEILLDAADGKVVERDEEAEDRSALVAAAGLTLPDAIAAVLKEHPGKAVLAQLLAIDGRPSVSVEVFDRGKKAGYLVAASGEHKGAVTPQGRDENAGKGQRPAKKGERSEEEEEGEEGEKAREGQRPSQGKGKKDERDEGSEAEEEGEEGEEAGEHGSRKAKHAADAKPEHGDHGGAEHGDGDGPFTEVFGEDDRNLGPTGRNPYFVLEPGYRLVLEGKDGGQDAQIVITVLGETRKIGGIDARVVEERETVGGKLKEVTRDYFAISSQTNNVYYLGEDVDEYADGKVAGHAGSWLHGQDGARYGLMMPGSPLLGARFQQEVAPGVALDRAEVASLSAAFECPAGTFRDVLVMVESTPLENGREQKHYARGVGLLQDGGLRLVRYGPEAKVK